MSSTEQLDFALHSLASGEKSARIPTVVAKKMMLQNEHVTIRGEDRYLRFLNLGLGVYEVTLADMGGAKKNLILKKS